MAPPITTILPLSLFLIVLIVDGGGSIPRGQPPFGHPSSSGNVHPAFNDWGKNENLLLRFVNAGKEFADSHHSIQFKRPNRLLKLSSLSRIAYNKKDLVVGHGSNLTLIQFKPNDAGDIHIKELFMNSSAAMAMMANSHQIISSSYWNKKTQISYLTSSLDKHLIFYTHEFIADRQGLGLGHIDLNVFNTATNEIKLLLSRSDMTFDDLLYFNNSLYWIDTMSNCIFMLNVQDVSSSAVFAVPKVIVNLSQTKTAITYGNRNIKFGGLTVDPNTGYLFWSIWPRNSFSIDYFNHKTVQMLLNTNLSYPTSLTIISDSSSSSPSGSSSSLYWINKPGNQFLIEKMQLLTDLESGIVKFTNRLEIYKGTSNQNLFSFIMLPSCLNSKEQDLDLDRDFLVTDTKSQNIFKINAQTGKSILIKHYTDSIPNGMILLNKNIQTHCSNSNDDNEESKSILPGRDPQIPKVLDNNNSTSTNNIMGPIIMSFCTYSTVGSGGNICLNGGTCFQHKESSFCVCPNGWTGPHCELEWNTLNSIPNSTISTSSLILHQSKSQTDINSAAENNTMTIAIISLGITVGILTLTIIYLGFRIFQLSKQPKIHRRLVVSRNGNQASGGQSVCEMIDIENCCNMNICETPCYETGLLLGNGSANPTSGGAAAVADCSLESEIGYSCDKFERNTKKIKEDKEKLID